MTDVPSIRAVIVDDEPLAREGVRLLLQRDPDIEVIDESGDGADAVEVIRRHRPDLVFLDVQIPEMNGFEVLSALGPEEMPAVIFITAHDRYALQAFEVNALDYLLKPYDDERFMEAVRRAKEHLRMERVSNLSQKLISLLEVYGDRSAFISRLAVRSAGRVVFVTVGEIDWIEAADYYVQLHVGSESYLHRQTMTSLERQLDPDRFIRIHRSAIVNASRIRELRHQGKRDLVVVLESGIELKVARSSRDKLQKLM
jgi:two-component system LytT family response regulator